MAVRPVVITGDPVLHRPAGRVESFDDELAQLVQDMFDTMDAAHGVGLAAPQIGVGRRLFVYEMANDDGAPVRGVVVNPILMLSKVSTERPDPDLETEGCLSVPGESFPLKRAEHARVSGFDLTGALLEFEATGWFARCMQHEFDHLNGKLYVDRLDERWSKRARKAIRKNGWGRPGHSWMPGVDRDPFGHDDLDGPEGLEGLDDRGHDEHLV
ncbi:peptide deformylase [Lapillicoccus sp.]|uniref:peptide deformylase n=1 Tax=Lapillicoccus sp. TaxID=1909287 RepID=UPI0025F35A89|nr:peptide deformylase [Lapillicoccus sp.]